MASKNTAKSYGYFKIEEVEEVTFSKKVRIHYPGKMIVTTPQGNRYVWEKAGDVLTIENQLDYEYIIGRKQPKSCCSGLPQQFVFIEV